MEERVIEKIRKCLALANNNPSEEEAKAAALQAQKLLAKYNINMADVTELEQEVEEIVEVATWLNEIVKGVARAWKYELAEIVAKNFRCKHFFYGKRAVVFYGHKTDAEAASEVYKYLFSMGDRIADREAHKAFHSTGITRGVYNSWVKGYLAGLRNSFDKQCTALMIVIPEDVKEGYAERSKNFRYMNADMRNTSFNNEAYNDGFVTGKGAMAQRSLEV